MSTGAQMLAWMTLALILDVLIGLWFRKAADRIERGETVPSFGAADAVQLRKTATILMWGMLPLWLVVALVAFGVIPTGIDTIKF